MTHIVFLLIVYIIVLSALLWEILLHSPYKVGFTLMMFNFYGGTIQPTHEGSELSIERKSISLESPALVSSQLETSASANDGVADSSRGIHRRRRHRRSNKSAEYAQSCLETFASAYDSVAREMCPLSPLLERQDGYESLYLRPESYEKFEDLVFSHKDALLTASQRDQFFHRVDGNYQMKDLDEKEKEELSNLVAENRYQMNEELGFFKKPNIIRESIPVEKLEPFEFKKLSDDYELNLDQKYIKGVLAQVLDIESAEAFKVIGGYEEWIDFIARCTMFIYQIYYSPSSKYMGTVCYQFLSQFSESVLDKTAMSVTLAVCHKMLKKSDTIQLVPESHEISSRLMEASEFLTKSFDNSASTALKTLLLSAASMKVFHKDVAMWMYANIGEKPRKQTPVEIIRDVLSSLAKLVRVGELVHEGVPLTTAVFADDPFAASYEDARRLLLYKDNISIGLPVEGMMDQAQFIQKGEALLAFFKNILSKKHLSKITARYKMTFDMSLTLEAALLDVKRRISALGRPTPFGLIVQGPPGIGKSSLITYIEQLWSFVKGRPFEVSHVFSRGKSEYWDGYNPASQPIIHISEGGSLHKDIAAKMGDQTLVEICSICDSQPYAVNMACLDLKGKIFARPEMVIIDSNTPDLNAKVSVNNPGAVARRFWNLEARVKPEHTISGTPMLSNANPTNARMMDKWLFKLYSNQALDEKKTTPVYEMNFAADDDIDKLKDTLIRIFQKSIVAQEQYVTDRANIKLSDYGSQSPWKMFKGVIGELSQATNRLPDIERLDVLNSIQAQRQERDPTLETQNWFQQPCLRSVDEQKTASLVLVPEARNRSAEELRRFFPQTRNNMFDWPFRFHIWIIGMFSYGYMNTYWLLRTIVAFLVVPWNWLNMFWFALYFIFMALFYGVEHALSSLMAHFAQRLNIMQRLPRFVDVSKTVCKMALAGTLYCLGFTSPLMVFITCFWAVCDPGHWTTVPKAPRPVRSVQAVGMSYHYCDKFLAWVGWCTPKFVNPFHAGYDVAFSMLSAATIVTLPIIWKWINGKDIKKMKSQASTFYTQDESNSRLQEIEKSAKCSRPFVPVKVETKNDWNVVSCKPSLHTSGGSSLCTIALHNTRRVVVKRPNGTECNTCILGLKGNLALINTHAITRDVVGVKLLVSRTGMVKADDTVHPESTLSSTDYAHGPNDLTLIRVSGLHFLDIMKHLAPDDYRPTFAEAWVGGKKTTASLMELTNKIPDVNIGEIDMTHGYLYSWPEHFGGACGTPVVLQRSQGFSIMGIHTAGAVGSEKGMSNIFSRPIVERMISSLPDVLLNLNSESSEFWMKEKFDMPSPKSVFRHEQLHGLEYFGKLPGPVMAHGKSHVAQTYMSKSLSKPFKEILNFVPTTFYKAPMMEPTMVDGNYVSPWNIGLKNMSTQRPSLDKKILLKCIDVFTQHIIDGLADSLVTSLSPWDMEAAINGCVDDPFCRRIDASKSAGFGYKGSKSKYMPIVQEREGYVVREADSDLKKRICDIIASYERNECADTVYVASLKDEPRDIKKVIQGKTRIFYISSMPDLVVCHMFLGPFYTLMVSHSHVFGAGLGSNMHKDGHKLRTSLSEFSSNIMEGDYSKYDQAMPFDIGWAAATVVHRVLKKLGYNEYALNMVQGILSDGLFVNVEVLKDFFCYPGLQPSGKYATAEDNSLRGILLLMYAFYSNPVLSHLDFFDKVKPLVYGDDVLAAVKDDVSDNYNNIYYADACKHLYGMDFTSSAKDAVLHKFVSLDDMSFLKRKFVYSETLMQYVAPLDMNSIFKTLAWYIPSNQVNPETQFLSVLQSTVREIFFHTIENPNKYNKMRDFLIDLYIENFSISDHHVVRGSIPTYDELIACFQLKPESDEKLINEESDCETCDANEQFYSMMQMLACNGFNIVLPPDNFTPESHESFKKVLDKTRMAQRSTLKEHVQIELVKLEVQLLEAKLNLDSMDHPMPGIDLDVVAKTSQYTSSVSYRLYVDRYRCRYSRWLELDRTCCMLRSSLVRMDMFRSESMEVGDMKEGIVPGSVVITHQNVEDAAGGVKDTSSAGLDEKSDQISSTSLEMSEYLSRPFLVYDTSLTIGTDITVQIDIWQTLLLLPAIRAKLKNYPLMRANLCVRVVVTATPMHYGRLQIAYIPQARLNDIVSAYIVNAETAQRPNFLKYLSMTEGCKNMNVNDNVPLDIKIPYVNYKPMLRLFNASTTAIGSSTSFTDTDNLGVLFLNTLVPLASVTTTPTSASVMIYAWFEDVELMSTTATVLTLATESDERKMGIIEKTATRVSNFASGFESVPTIGIYATASRMVSSTISSVASLFGWSTPNVITKPERIKNEPFQNAANLIGFDTGKRITLDPLQELSVDPRICGVQKDELVISDICRRETLLDTPAWTSADNQLTPFWSCAVNPAVSVPVVITTQGFYQPTALGFAAMPFDSWRGDMTFRFDIVVSKFHRGRLGVFFEPNICQYLLVTTNLTMNKNFMVIVDIQETQSFEVTVKWNFPRSWAHVLAPTDASSAIGTIVSPLTLLDFANGFISIAPITRLQSPDSSNVTILVFVKSDNMVFNYYNEANLPSSISLAITGDEKDFTFVGESSDSVRPNTNFVINSTSASQAHISMDHYGETPISFRALLKRFEDVNLITGTGTLGTEFSRVTAVFPILSEPTPSISTDRALGVPASLFSYLRYAFVAFKGGLRRRIRFVNLPSSSDTSRINASLMNVSTVYATPSCTIAADVTTDTIINGTVMFVPSTNGGVEIEIPFYSNNLYVTAGTSQPYQVSDTNFDSVNMQSYAVQMETKFTGTTAYVQEEVAFGEDATLIRWIAAVPFSITIA